MRMGASLTPETSAASDYDRIRAIPLWSGSIEITPLIGGITNKNFIVTESSRDRFVVRLGNDIPEHGVMRFNELAAARAAHAAGISPEVVAAGPGYIVSRFLEGRSLSPEEVRSPAHREQIIDLVRRCHVDIPKHFRGPALIFWVFQVNRSYIGALREDGSRLTDALPRLEKISANLERIVGPVEIVFGHNDLLPGNLFDDGKRLWLLDWDYAGFNTALFDLANLSSNNGFGSADDTWLLDAYFGATPPEATVRAFHAMKCASLLREGLWSAVSERRSTIDFDYVAYTNDNLARFEASFAAFEQRYGLA